MNGPAIMYGLAIGDALGYPVEFVDPGRNAAEVTDLVIDKARGVALYSDDTQMAIAVTRALLIAGELDADAFGAACADEFVKWSISPDNDRAPGNTCMDACAKLRAGAHWRDAGIGDSKGAGAVMRVAPIAAYCGPEPTERSEMLARVSAMVTHQHPAAIASAAAFVRALQRAMAGWQVDRILDDLVRYHEESEDLARRLSQVAQLLERAPARTALSTHGLGESWVAEEAVASALWIYGRHWGDYATAVLTAANTPGDSDTIACMAGALCAASAGELRAIPMRWRATIENSATLMAMGQLLDHASLFQRGLAS